MGLLSGVAGIVLTGYVAAGTIGGTSLMGGKGTILGALVGTLIMASLENGMSIMNMSVF